MPFLSTFNPNHSNQIYWVPIPNNLSYPSGERKILVCLVSKQPENKFPVTDLIFALVWTNILHCFLINNQKHVGLLYVGQGFFLVGQGSIY